MEITKDKGITAKCEKCGDTQTVFTPDHPYDKAVKLASLMDGSLFYPLLFPSATTAPSPLGQCGKCEGRFKCFVFGYDPEVPEAAET